MSAVTFAAAHAARPVKRRGTVCGVAKARARMSPEDRDALDAALADPDDTAAGITDTLQALGYDVRQNTVARHRRGDCRC